MVSDVPATAPRSKRWAPLAALVGALVLVLAWWLVRPAPGTDLRGVRLGLSASDTRTLFQAPGPGSWSSESNPEPILRWKAQPGALIHEAIFEFHQGMLVAIRLRVDPSSTEAQGPPLEVTQARVVSRGREGEEALVTVLSRTCPTHAPEVARLLRGGS